VVDLPVLAEATEEVAVGKEDRSRASLADQGALFAVMRTERVELELGRGAAKALLSIDSIGTAFPWTAVTRLKNLPELFLDGFQPTLVF
jgi:hypothetical protein